MFILLNCSSFESTLLLFPKYISTHFKAITIKQKKKLIRDFLKLRVSGLQSVKMFFWDGGMFETRSASSPSDYHGHILIYMVGVPWATSFETLF